MAQPSKSVRTGEGKIKAAILELMSDGETWSNADLKRAIPKIIVLSDGDCQLSRTRPGEQKWEALANNALTQSGRANSLYAQGLVVNAGNGRHRSSMVPAEVSFSLFS